MPFRHRVFSTGIREPGAPSPRTLPRTRTAQVSLDQTGWGAGRINHASTCLHLGGAACTAHGLATGGDGQTGRTGSTRFTGTTRRRWLRDHSIFAADTTTFFCWPVRYRACRATRRSSPASVSPLPRTFLLHRAVALPTFSLRFACKPTTASFALPFLPMLSAAAANYLPSTPYAPFSCLDHAFSACHAYYIPSYRFSIYFVGFQVGRHLGLTFQNLLSIPHDITQFITHCRGAA